MTSCISVVIPVYNGASHLAAAIASALAQSLPPERIIIVDDGSDDGSSNVAAGFADRVLYVRQDHAGTAKARNTGVRHVQTEYLAFLDADDLWAPFKLELQIRELLNVGVPTMVFGHTVQFASPELSSDEAAKVKFNSAPMPAIAATALFMRTRDFQLAGPFDTSLRSGEFIDWYARAQDRGISTRVPKEVLVRRRIHRENHGRREADRRGDYARALKLILDRRRSSS